MRAKGVACCFQGVHPGMAWCLQAGIVRTTMLRPSLKSAINPTWIVVEYDLAQIDMA